MIFESESIIYLDTKVLILCNSINIKSLIMENTKFMLPLSPALQNNINLVLLAFNKSLKSDVKPDWRGLRTEFWVRNSLSCHFTGDSRVSAKKDSLKIGL